jgi:hypothetical protein
MHRVLTTLLVSGWLLAAAVGPLAAQGHTPGQPPPPPPPVEKAKEPEPYTRDNSPMMVYYALAGIGAILVMVLVCMPARRD